MNHPYGDRQRDPLLDPLLDAAAVFAQDPAVEAFDNWSMPTIPVSAGALLFDEAGGLLILKPTYKSGWTIPGGIMEADGESPWDACRREVREETGLTVTSGRLLCVDTRPARPGRRLGLRYLFHCGAVTPQDKGRIRIQREEISQYRFAPLPEALDLLRGPIRRRVREGLHSAGCVYLEDGRRVDGVG